ncbi:hypothetical protein ONS95_003467 [Cadophora gregata]|uniref:uncharacterized protein n=1 Tax=Cadophora gregata TaxID=51156 RepID=UPI0026DA7315|nr:uncharacterized protein ONS95_003467 [Cadophora gregata]KAK0108675.1 hypothetical protein ONS95_003467 [Cadophora gregata]KAK0108735.1 hypothetical protein ONS96_002580 [Cadophora gregata f. sp. sojae]
MSISAISAEEKQRALDLHNEARRSAPGPPRHGLVWSDSLSAAAAEWGKKMVQNMKRQGELQHDPSLRKKPYTMGENLFGGEGGKMDLCTAIRGWVREKRDYKGEPMTANGRNGRGVMVGHYTQIICSQTTKVGMVKIWSGEWLYIVARYDGPQEIGSLPWGGHKHLSVPSNPSLLQKSSTLVTAGPSAKSKPARSLPDHEIEKILDLHNEARHEAPGGPRPDLVWSETLAILAMAWAKKLARRNTGMKHDDQWVMGENLFWSKYNVQSYSSAIRAWINEKWHYHGEAVGDEDPNGEQVGHYTQIICHDVTKVGMARVTKGSDTYIVARYDTMQVRGTTPWGSATQLPAGAVDHRPDSSHHQHSRYESGRSRRHHQSRNSSSHRSDRHQNSLIEDTIDGMPRLVIKNSKISFHPFGRRRPR